MMLNYVSGEFYRLIRKKNMYLWAGIIALGYMALTYIRSSGLENSSMATDILDLSQWFPILIGGYLFISVYIDDLQARNLTTLIGFGLSKTTIIIAKLIVMALFSLVALALFILVIIGTYWVLGFDVTTAVPDTIAGGQLGLIGAVVVKNLGLILGFSALSSIIAYGFQQPTFATATYFALATGLIGSLFATAFNLDFIKSSLPHLADNVLLSNISDRLMLGMITPSGDNLVTPIIEIVLFIALATIVAIIVFTRKEVEF